MNICKNCDHEFESQAGTIQVCPMCGEQIELQSDESADIETESHEEIFEIDDDPGQPMDDSDEAIFEIDCENEELEPEQTFVSTQEPEHADDLLLPKVPLDARQSTAPVDSDAYAATEMETAAQADDGDDDFELVDDAKTELATEFYDPDEHQPTIEIQDKPITASSLDYAEREIGGLTIDDSVSSDADYVISLNEEKSQLGSGASGVVYKAIQKSLDRTVAIKLLKKQIQAGTQSQSRKTTPKQKDIEKFLYESQITAGLDHPNVITVHDLGVTSNNTLFYSMKLFEGGKDWSKEFDKNTLEENLDVFNDVCDAMRRAHRDRIIHRDLKPQNVLVGDFGEVQVTDWGLAIDLKTEGNQEFSGGGTPCYMAPEMSKHYLAQQELRALNSKLEWTQENAPQSSDEIIVLKETIVENEAKETQFRKLIGEKSDVYVMGAILFQIAAGYPPHLFQVSDIHRKQWGSEAGKNKVRRELQMSAEGKVASYLVRNLPNPEAREALRDIALKAMQVTPDERTATVADLQQEVRDFRDFMRCIEDTQRGNREVDLSNEDRKSYVNLNNAMYAFEGALENYPEYEPANAGLAKARFLFAERALNNQDFELGLSTMTDDAIEHQPDKQLASRLRDELVTQRNRRDRRKKMLFIATMASLVSIGLGVIFGMYAAYASAEATKQNKIAQLKKQEASAAVEKAEAAQAQEIDAKEKLLNSLAEFKQAKNDTIDDKVTAAMSKLELAKINKEKEVGERENAITKIESEISSLESNQATKLASVAAQIADVDKSLAEIDKIKAQIDSEKIKEQTQFNQYKTRLKEIESGIDEEITKSRLQNLFGSDDISMPVKNAWELHHLYKKANPATEPIENDLLGDLQLLKSSDDGGVMVALTNNNQLFRFSKSDTLLIPIEIENLRNILSMDVSRDGRWLIVANEHANDDSLTDVDSLPIVVDLKTNTRVPFASEIIERLRFRSPKPDGTICKEKFYCRVQHVQALSSNEDNLRIFMVDQRARTGMNQIRCSVLDIESNGVSLDGQVQKAKVSGQLFLKSPGLLTSSGCIATASETNDGDVVVAIANSYPKFEVVAFSLDSADEITHSQQTLRSVKATSEYFSQMKQDRVSLDTLSTDFAPTALQFIDADSENIKLLIGNGKGEIASLEFHQSTESPFMMSATNRRLLTPFDQKLNAGYQAKIALSNYVNKRNNRQPITINRIKSNVLSSTNQPTLDRKQPSSKYPVHNSPVRQIKSLNGQVFSISETEIIVWDRNDDKILIDKKLYGQNGKIKAISAINVSNETQLYTASNRRNNAIEMRRWLPETSVHDANIPLENFRTSQGTSKRIVAGDADQTPGSNTVALAFDNGTFEYFDPDTGAVTVDNPRNANLPNGANELSVNDFRNSEFEYFDERQQLVMYSNSTGILTWNMKDRQQTDPIRSEQQARIYTGEPKNSAVYFSSDSSGQNIVTSHPKRRDKFVMWQLNDEFRYSPTEIGPFQKGKSKASGRLNVVVQPKISPDGKTTAVVVRVRNAYQVQLLQTGPSKNPNKIATFNSDPGSSFRSLHFIDNQRILIAEDRVNTGVERVTGIFELVETGGQWTDQLSQLPKALTEEFGKVSIMDFAQRKGKTIFAGFAIKKTDESNGKADLSNEECNLEFNNRELIAWNEDEILLRRNVPFSRRVAPRFVDGQLCYFVDGGRSTNGKLEFAEIDGESELKTSIVVDDHRTAMQARKWDLSSSNNLVVAGGEWFYLAKFANDRLEKRFEFSLTNQARRIALANKNILVHHKDESASHIRISANSKSATTRIPGLFKFTAISPDGNHCAFIRKSNGNVLISNTEKLADDLEQGITIVDKKAIALNWVHREALKNLVPKIIDEFRYALAVAKIGDECVNVNFYTETGKPLDVPINVSCLPLKVNRNGPIKSFDFSSRTGELASIVWLTDDSDRCDIWKFAMNDKPNGAANVHKEWSKVVTPELGKIQSVHFSEVIDEDVAVEQVAPRIVVSSENQGTKTIRLLALEMGLNFQTMPLLDLFVTDKLQMVDDIVGARFTGDGKTLLTMTAERANVRLSDGWSLEKQDIDFDQRIRHFKIKSEAPNELDEQKNELIKQQEANQIPDPELENRHQKRKDLEHELEIATADLEQQQKNLNLERAEVERELNKQFRAEIEQLDSQILEIKAELKRLGK